MTDADGALAALGLDARAGLHVTRRRLELRNIRNARERVWQKLQLSPIRDDGTVIIDRPLKEMAGEIGLTHEALYRSLAALEKAGRIRRRGRTIRLAL